jgi:small subunit ribosomal protein S2e
MAQEKEWQPVTKLGRLVKAGKIKSMEEMYVQENCRNLLGY